MRKLLLIIGLAAIAVAPLAPRLFGQRNKQEQPTTRSVEGVVTDPGGKPVAGAVVHLKNTKTLQIRSFISKDDGTYSFHGLSTNVDYELKAEYKDASSDVKTLSVFDSRTKAVINLKLNQA